MRLPAGVRLGPYELLGLLGAGGMGEVYKARDTRLDRTVAIKVLSEPFAADPDRRERFEREARAVAALNHPHICNLHDVGEAPSPEPSALSHESVRFLVMEYLEGQTLADRLVRGPLPAAEVMRNAVELADALDHAHRRGLVHRDLKPGNVMLTKGGTKLLDFGLSRLQTKPDLLALSTIAPGGAPLTAEGTVLGTFPYMAPEQLTGREADARSDIFGFGAMVYEMATGRRAFEGSTAATVIGAILHTDPPPVSALQPLAPSGLDRIVARCLAKDPDDRWQTARDLTFELKWSAEHAAPIDVNRPLRKNRTFGLMVTAALAILAVAAAAFTLAYVRRTPADEATASLAFSPPDGLTLAAGAQGGSVAISPNGRHLAFVATDRSGRRLLWWRQVESFAAQALPETDGAMYPFWSSDSRFIGFFAQKKLKKIQVSGGPPQMLCDALQPRGGAWSRGGVIVFASGAGHQLSRVPAGGGVATPLPADGLNVERYWPSFLPDGNHFVYFGRPQKHGIYLAALDSSPPRLLLPDYVSVAYSPPGYLLVLIGTSKGGPNSTLMAQPFDPEQLRTTGEPSPVAEQVGYYSGLGLGMFSVSENGRLVYGAERRATQLTWFDRTGRPLGDMGESIPYTAPSFSPDEKTVAVERVDPGTQNQNLWLIETARKAALRFTSDPSLNLNIRPVWSPDGTRIVFAGAGGAPPNLYQKTENTDGAELLLKSSFNSQPTDWSSDGRFVVYASLNPQTSWDLWLLPMTGPPADRKPVPFIESEDNEHLARFSPDGRWLAYVSDESLTNEVYVRTFPEAGVKLRVSANGGTDPKWRGDGRELFYSTADGRFMAVRVKPGATLEVGPPEELFKARLDANASVLGYATSYAVTRDGQRFLVSTVTEESTSVPTKIVLNWPAALGRR